MAVSTSDKQAFITLALPLARWSAEQLGLPIVSPILAQWAIESDWGRSALARYHHNLAGISYTKFADYRGSNKPAIEGGGPYSGFNSYESFAKDYVRVLRLSYYAKALEAGRAGDGVGMLMALAESPYAAGHYGLYTFEGVSLLKILPEFVQFDLPPEPSIDWQARYEQAILALSGIHHAAEPFVRV